MRREAMRWAVAVGFVAACAVTYGTETPAAPQNPPTAASSTPSATSAQPAQAATGGKLHGVVKSGNTPLPGVTVTAQNTLTGKRYQTTTDITGAWSLTIPDNGRYVVRTQFAAFAQGSAEALLNAASHDQSVNLDLMLASRAAVVARQEDRQEQGVPTAEALQAIQRLASSGAQSLSLMGALTGDTETQNGGGVSGAALPSIAGNSDFAGDSLAISGQAGQVSPMAGMDMDRIRDAIETMRSQTGSPGAQGGGLFGGGGLGGMGGGFGGPGGGFGGGGFGGDGFGGGGRGNFRGFNPGQPHGAIFWTGSNSALNAEPFALNGQSQEQPANGTNRFGITFMSAPYLPHFTKPSGRDGFFVTISGSRNSNPLDEYATVPTDAERGGDFTGQPTIYDPANDTRCSQFGATPGEPFPNNVIPSGCIAPPATKLLLGSQSVQPFFPEPNLTGSAATNGYNYHLLTTEQTNTSQVGIRYMRALGKNASLLGGRGGGRRSQTSQSLRQSLNFNYNWSHNAQDDVNLFPQLGGNGSTDGQSAQAGYTLGYKKVTSIFNANWNLSKTQTLNYFTNRTDVATDVGILGPNGALNSDPLNYGLPDITLSQFASLSQQQPSLSVSQTFSLSETLSWIHGKHNLRFGGDFRRVHRDFLGGSNSTGSFTFSGKFTQNNGDSSTGSALADFLLGLPQGTSIDVAAGKSYLREDVTDLFALDDWRVRSNLTLNYGIRYEFFAPFTEKYGHLAFVDTNPIASGQADAFSSLNETQAGQTGVSSGSLPNSLVFPFRLGLAPRVSFALRLPKQTVLRGGFGMNYTNTQYATFATAMAHQPMAKPGDLDFVNEQNNVSSTPGAYTLVNGFPSPATTGSYSVDPHCKLPYVEVWNLDIQKTLPWGVVLNVGYNGSKGNHLNVTSAPRVAEGSTGTNPNNVPFSYEQSAAFSKFNAGTLRLNKRLSNGLALGANYLYSHSIDNAGSVGGTSTVVAQDWRHLEREEGNSSFDVRHKVSGTYLYELPFGQDKRWLTAGTASHIFEGFSISGTFTFATGLPLTPGYSVAVSDVAHGAAGTLRPNIVPGISPTAGGATLKKWFNPSAYAQPAADAYGNAFGNVSRNSIAGPGTVENNMSLSKTLQLRETRSMEFRATASNVFNTVQYTGIDTKLDTANAGQVTSAGSMRAFNFTARFRF